MAALAAARVGATVAICEKDERLGKTILATGNGRCNLSNTAIIGEDGTSFYHNPSFVAPTLERYNCVALRDVFEGLGLLTFADDRGWVYPRSRWANSVLNVLLNEVGRQGVAVRTGQEVKGIQPVNGGGFRVQTAASTLVSRALVLACGGFVSGRPAPCDGIASLLVVTPTPILAPLRTDAEAVKGLDGVRVHCRATLWGRGNSQSPQQSHPRAQPQDQPSQSQQPQPQLLQPPQPLAQETGELLFRGYGVSGIAIFNLSRFAQPGHQLSLDFFCDLSVQELSALLNRRWNTGGYETWGAFLDGMLHTRLGRAVLRAARLPLAQVPAPPLFDKLAQALKGYRLTITAGADGRLAQVMRGGWATEGFDPATLGSRTYSGLYAAGECLDVDGPCGGFNLHWAWASGLVAGQSAACHAMITPPMSVAS
jgi:predicted flavoprotein YhiN